MRSITWNGARALRLARHFLLTPAPKERLVDVVGAVCGIHAQMMPAAELSLGLRVAGMTRGEIGAELWERRTLVKTYGIRGTVHLFPAHELPLWLAALRAGIPPGEDRRLAEMGLDPAQKETVLDAIGGALDGRCLTREELGAEVGRRTGEWALDSVSPAFGGRWPRWQMALGAAALEGLLCFGPNRGSKVTFVRPDQWIGPHKTVDGPAALREVLRRYLAGYGPATHRDFAGWFRMQPATALALQRELEDELEEVDVEGHRAWLLKDDAETSWPAAQNNVHLLPHFDCFVVGSRPREYLLSRQWRERGLPTSGNLPVLLLDGVVAGHWRHARKGHHLELQVEPLQPLNGPQRIALEVAADRIGAIAEAGVTLSPGPVEARPHL